MSGYIQNQCLAAGIPYEGEDVGGTLQRLIDYHVEVALSLDPHPSILKSISEKRDPTTGLGYAVSQEDFWRYDKAPTGVKLFLLTEGGIATEGPWRDDGSYLAWHPLFKRDHALEATLPRPKGRIVARD